MLLQFSMQKKDNNAKLLQQRKYQSNEVHVLKAGLF